MQDLSKGKSNAKFRKTKIDIIIPTYNSARYITKLLRSIVEQTYPHYRCFVIDDCSQDGTVALIQDKFSWVHFIQQPRNKGPAHNRNIAIRQGKSPYLVILDADAFLQDKQWLKKALEIMEKNPRVGQIASQIVSGYDPEILLDCGIQGEGPFFGGIFSKKHWTNVYGKHQKPRRVLGACTAGTIIRRDVFEKVGGFDPKYFYPGEDLDLSLRIHLAGYDVRYVPLLVVHHYEGKSMSIQSRCKQYLFQRNSLLVLIENFPFKHALRKITKFFWQEFLYPFLRSRGERVRLCRRQGRLFGWLLLHLGHILVKRLSQRRTRRRPRDYLLRINHKLQQEIALSFPLQSLIFLITNRCNAQCKMCFLDRKLNRPVKELTLSEIQRFFQSCRELQNVVLSGGEPFLREDLVEICRILIAGNNPAITIPTNGSLEHKIYDQTKKILALGCKRLVISFSLDGRPAYHDTNRGIPGLFDRVLKSYQKLLVLQNIFNKSLELQVNTCVTQENLKEIDHLYHILQKRMPLVRWVLEPVRGTFNRKQATALPYEQWVRLARQIKTYRRRGNQKDHDNLKLLFQYSLRTLKEQRQIVPCCGGREFIVLDWAGNLSPCEMFPALVNIQDLAYNINHLFIDQKWQEALRRIKKGKCYCTHFCWLAYSLCKQRKLSQAIYF